MLWRRSCYEIVKPLVAKDLECILPNRRRAAPDQDRVPRTGRAGCWDRPQERELEINRHGVEDSDEVVSEHNPLLESKSCRDLKIGVRGIASDWR
jgi:hypothetical protein